METIEIKPEKIFKNLPQQGNDGDILQYLQNNIINSEHIQLLKEKTDFTDEEISNWLNISEKTFRTYKKPRQILNMNLQEHLLLLLSLMKHGAQVFGSTIKFNDWLKLENFYFNEKAPMVYLNTITGIRFIDDRITAMEYGDNV